MENDIWGTVSLEDKEVHFCQLGDLYLWLRYKNKEIWIAYCYKDELSDEADESIPPEDIKYARWAHKGGHATLKILPALADLPLIVHSEYSLKISPYTDIQVYSRVPIWIAISVENDGYQLIELPVSKLSKTWFGTPLEGESCYYTTTKARRNLSKVTSEPHLVTCPITIANKSSEVLDFERFCFRVERLGIYKHDGFLWTDETQITYRGEDQNSDVIMTGKLPEGITKQMQIAKPRKKIQTSLATRTFKRLIEDTLTLGR